MKRNFQIFLIPFICIFIVSCSDDEGQDPINPKVDFNFTVSSELAPAKLNVENLSMDAENYYWSFEGGIPSSSNLENPGEVTYQDAGVYEIILYAIVGNDSIFLSKSFELLAKPSPNFNFTISSEFAPAILTIENLSADAENYYWSFDGGIPSSSILENPGEISYEAPGIYEIILYAITKDDSVSLAKTFELMLDPSVCIFDKVNELYTWQTFIEEVDMPFEGRWTALPFIIDNFLYVGGGGEADGVSRRRYKSDFYKIDLATGTFESIPDFPAGTIGFGTSFSLDGVGYVGTGRITDGGARSNLCYTYNPTTNEWVEAVNFPGDGRTNALSETVDKKAYFGFGINQEGDALKDFYEFDPVRNTWESLATFPGEARFRSMMFSICNDIYVVAGNGRDPDNNLLRLKDTWKYDIENDEWTQVADLPYPLNAAGSISIEGYGYLISGQSDFLNETEYCSGVAGNTRVNDVLRYDPDADIWEIVNSFPYCAREYPLTFAYNKELYFGSSGILLNTEEFLGEYGIYKMTP